jgi:hypothetical protein
VFGFPRGWCIDTEFGDKPAGQFGPAVRCLVAKDPHGRAAPVQWWYTDPLELLRSSFDFEHDLFVAYNVVAELQCFIELGLPMPCNVIDLWPEYRAITNGRRNRKDQTRLIDALTYYQIDHIGAVEKTEMQQLARRGPPYTEAEKLALLLYCESDVDALIALLKS